MQEKTFLTHLEEMLEVDAGTLKLTAELTSIEQWDSLAFVSFLAMADSKYGIKVAPSELRQCKTVGDLMKLVNKE
jgi:acyl carrier protein